MDLVKYETTGRLTIDEQKELKDNCQFAEQEVSETTIPGIVYAIEYAMREKHWPVKFWKNMEQNTICSTACLFCFDTSSSEPYYYENVNIIKYYNAPIEHRALVYTMSAPYMLFEVNPEEGIPYISPATNSIVIWYSTKWHPEAVKLHKCLFSKIEKNEV